MKYLLAVIATAAILSCNNQNSGENKQTTAAFKDSLFAAFENRFIDAYWKQNPSSAIYAGYGKYYDILKIPDSASIKSDVDFSKQYLDSLHSFDYASLSSNNKIDYRILENQFNGIIWYTDTFKQQEWDPSIYNIGSECYEIITKNYAPLTERLQTLSSHIAHADIYYAASLQMIHQPTKEHTDLAVKQNKGSLEVFGQMLSDSVKASSLTQAEKDTLLQRAARTKAGDQYICYSS